MNSLLIPSNVIVSISDAYINRVGPKGSFRASTKGFQFHIITTPEGKRLVASAPSFSSNKIKQSPVSTILSLIARRIEGISVGYRHRIRLVGVGFRATAANNAILIKIGYSHDISLDLNNVKKAGVMITPSRIDGRTKGTILQCEGSNPSRLFHQINCIQRFRRPDPYKAKGIHIDGQQIRRKKGKREA